MYFFLRLTLFFFSLIFITPLIAQQWKNNLTEDETNFYTIQREFNNVWIGKTPGRGVGWKQFKRWEWFWEQRVYPNGEFPAADVLSQRMVEYNRQFPRYKSSAANWSLIGPSVVPSSAGGAGRINCVAFHPQNSNIIWVGSASGGLWKSTNGGSSWTTNTDGFGSMGITAIAFDPSNANIMFIATGDGDAGDTYSLGVLKSTDGGATWNTTGLNWTASQTRTISSLIAHPTNSSILLAATSNGIYRTSDGGTNWTQIITGNFKDLEVNKTDPTIWYATRNSTGVYKSTNTGTSFSQLTTDLPTSGFGRIAVAIAQSSATTIYALYVNSSSGYYGLYKSTNSGTNWTQQSTTPNILSWDGTGTDGQGWYDLVLDVDPTNASTIYVGGVNLYKSTTSGTSWTKITHWYSGAGYPYIHADQHGFGFLPGSSSTLFAVNDGGIFKSTDAGTTWSDLSNGLAISQFYKLGTSATNANRIYAGAQDNGTDRYLSGSWTRVIGGDGMEALIDYSNENIGYGELYYGDIRRTTNGGSSWTSIRSGIGEDGGWVTPYIINPINPQSLYLGTTKVYKTLNRGTSWTAISSAFTGSTLIALAIAPSDTNVILASTASQINKTTNGGSTWSNITSGLPAASITYVAVHPANASTFYVTLSGYGSEKVYKTTNGGTSWSNVSTGLPSIPANCIAIHPSSPSELYVGMDVGVYYSSNGGTSWTQFFEGLPNVIVNELEFHATTSKLRAATYGRGIWETPVTINSTSISGLKFNDANGNGIKDAGENGISNWRIRLTGTLNDSILTDGYGNYGFYNLNPGNYTVSEEQKSGWTQTFPSFPGTHSVALSSGQVITGINFGNRPIGSISGMKYNDVNENGSFDVGEPGLSNWKIRIAGPYSDSTLTDANGNFSLVITQAGTFIVSEVQQIGWTQTSPAAPGTYSLTFTSGNNYTSINFGNKVAPLTTLPTVDFEDGAVPPPLWTLYNPENDFTWESWSVSAYNIGAKSARVNMFSYSQTGKIDELRSPIVNGYAASDTLVFDYAYAQYSATYVDSFRVQLSYDGGTTYPTSLFYAWGSSLATATTTTSSFVPTGAQWVTKKFPLNAQVVNANVVIKFKTTNGYGNNLYLDNVSVKKATPTGSISGTTFNDANGNGVKDVGESGLANWRIKISGAKIDSTLTNGSGVYTFTSVPAGNFTVSEVVQSGWTQTLPASPGTYSVTLSSGQSVTGKDFGNQAIQYSSISGILFNDLNGNGVKEGGETGLANWRIRLAGAKTDSILTDANGNFSFGNLLQGSYTVSEVQQIGWLQTLPLSPGTYSVNLSSGQNVVNKDFGNQQLGIISGMKFLDANNNGVKDVNEAGLPNWKIKLSGSKTDSTVTNENGNYTFYNLFSGTYFLNEVQQNGWLQTFPVTPGSHTVPLTTGQQITEKNFGNFNPASISGQLFLDINGNGIVNSGEGVLTGWKIKLSGSSTDSTLSDANGNYNFTNLLAGNYVVTEVVQQGWKQTYPASGGNHSLTLSLGQQSSGKNFGNFQLGKVTGKIFHDANSNAIFDDGENVLAGWKVKLSGVRSDSTISDGTGTYLFENLFVGDYSLTLESPSDWTQTTPENISSHNITITESGEIVNGKNFGAFKWGTLSGVVFNDIDGDTLLNEGEEGISDVTVFVRQSETTTPFDSVVTTSNGTFFFDKLPYGSLSFVAFVRHGNDLRKSTNTVTIDVVSGSVNTNRNFAIFYPARISGIKYLDRDADNSFDDNESGIEGATIYLSGTQSVDSVTTDESGLYSFLNVYAGTYTVSSKATFSGGVVSPNEEVSVVSGSEVSNVNFSEYVPATITVRKYIDSDTDSSTIDDRSGKEWTLSVYTGLNADSMIYSANDSIVEVSSVVPGNYSVAESDSIYWKNLMIRVSNNGTPQANNVLSNKTGTRFTVRSGDNYIVSFINTAPDESRYRTFEASNNFALKSQKLSVKNTKPTVANIRDTVVKKINGLTLGLAQTHKDSVKKYGWIYWKKGTDVLKMYTEPHTAGPYPFDSIRLSGKKAKVFLKGLKATRKNYNNTLAEHFGIFKLNVFASAYNITPAGFLQLLYEQPSSIFHGMRLLDIASKLDTVLTRYKVNGDNYNYLAIQDMLIELNKSFATTLSDTDVISLSPLRFDGDRMLREVPFLRRDPTMISRSLPEFEQQNSTVAEDFILNQNYPNPFNPQTAIRFVTNDAGVASLTVFDILGKKIATLLDNTEVEDGEHEIIFNASGLPSGIYYYRLQFSSGEKQSFSETKKLLLLK